MRFAVSRDDFAGFFCESCNCVATCSGMQRCGAPVSTSASASISSRSGFASLARRRPAKMIPMDIAFPVDLSRSTLNVPSHTPVSLSFLASALNAFQADDSWLAFDLFERKPAACVTCARLIDQVADAVRDADAFARCLRAQPYDSVFLRGESYFFHGAAWESFS